MIRKRYGDEFVKAAEDAINPANISGGGGKPLLQTESGVPNALMQGSEVGNNTPRETAPTSGEGGGRELLSSVEAAINATKRQAKQQNKGALAEVLSEPAMSSAHDKTLAQSLDNTSSAGVKISSAQADAARELLRKFQSESSENADKLAARMKLAQDPDMAAAPAAPPKPAPPGSAPPGEEPGAAPEAVPPAAGPPDAGMTPPPEAGMGGGEEMPVSDEALEAVKAGVTPEEVAEAEQLLAAQGAMAAQAAPAPEAPAPAEAGGPVEAAPPPPMPLA
jgi:hypothetical protein